MTIRLCAAAAALSITAIATTAQAETWDMPMAYADSNYHTQNGKLFAEAVTTCTGGELEIVVHGGGSLFKGGEIKRAVQTGQAPIGERLLSAHANENALFGIDSVPFLATSFEASDTLAAAARPAIEEILAEQNLVLLYSVPWPPQGLYTAKPVESAADLAGLKFRAYNAATARLAELADMQPVQIEAAELSQALATGVAESFISSGSTGYDRKVWEQLTHFYDTQAWLPRNYVVANKDAFDAASDRVKGCLRSAAMLAEVAGTTRARELTGWYLSQLAAEGMTVQPPGEALAGDLAEIGATMASEWAEAAGAEGAAVLEAYRTE
ncbi:MAG: TRAP transporter substrate-binding protein [Paracoccaceae bacterium]